MRKIITVKFPEGERIPNELRYASLRLQMVREDINDWDAEEKAEMLKQLRAFRCTIEHDSLSFMPKDLQSSETSQHKRYGKIQIKDILQLNAC